MGKKILIIEDDEQNRVLLQQLLQYHGYEILEAENGSEGIRIAGEEKPDAILMDLQLPLIDGYTAIRLLRADPATAGIPIIAVTAYAMKGDREKALEAGADEYLSKPISVKDFPLILAKLLS
ncbi:MAG: response regulator [Thermodesulfovibrionales bacterium]|jgi:CheY-like chemotaxis protein